MNRTFKAINFLHEDGHGVPHAYDEETCEQLGCQIREVFEFPAVIKHFCPVCGDWKMARGFSGDKRLYCMDCGSELLP